MPQPRYQRTSGAVFNLHLHFVWCPKYRRKVLVGDVETRLRELLYEKAAELGIEVEGLEVMPDHVHLFIAVPPTDAPQFYANQLKGYTSRMLRQEFPTLKSRRPSLWSRSYYVGSAGHVSSAVIQRYIARQKERG
jgi:putative transposase